MVLSAKCPEIDRGWRIQGGEDELAFRHGVRSGIEIREIGVSELRKENDHRQKKEGKRRDASRRQDRGGAIDPRKKSDMRDAVTVRELQPTRGNGSPPNRREATAEGEGAG